MRICSTSATSTTGQGVEKSMVSSVAVEISSPEIRTISNYWCPFRNRCCYAGGVAAKEPPFGAPCRIGKEPVARFWILKGLPEAAVGKASRPPVILLPQEQAHRSSMSTSLKLQQLDSPIARGGYRFGYLLPRTLGAKVKSFSEVSSNSLPD